MVLYQVYHICIIVDTSSSALARETAPLDGNYCTVLLYESCMEKYWFPLDPTECCLIRTAIFGAV